MADTPFLQLATTATSDQFVAPGVRRRGPRRTVTLVVRHLVLVAESAKGRRNRIGTVLVRRRSDHPDDDAEEPDSA